MSTNHLKRKAVVAAMACALAACAPSPRNKNIPEWPAPAPSPSPSSGPVNLSSKHLVREVTTRLDAAGITQSENTKIFLGQGVSKVSDVIGGRKSEWTETTSLDPNGREIEVTKSSKVDRSTRRKAYDVNGRLESETYLTEKYQGETWIAEIQEVDTYAFTAGGALASHIAKRVASTGAGSERAETYERDTAGRPTKNIITFSGGERLEENCLYDTDGRLLRAEVKSSDQVYSKDGEYVVTLDWAKGEVKHDYGSGSYRLTRFPPETIVDAHADLKTARCGPRVTPMTTTVSTLYGLNGLETDLFFGAFSLESYVHSVRVLPLKDFEISRECHSIVPHVQLGCTYEESGKSPDGGGAYTVSEARTGDIVNGVLRHIVSRKKSLSDAEAAKYRTNDITFNDQGLPLHQRTTTDVVAERNTESTWEYDASGKQEIRSELGHIDGSKTIVVRDYE